MSVFNLASFSLQEAKSENESIVQNCSDKPGCEMPRPVVFISLFMLIATTTFEVRFPLRCAVNLDIAVGCPARASRMYQQQRCAGRLNAQVLNLG